MGLTMDFSKLQPQDALDLAIFAENEAQEYYEQLATWTEANGKAEVAQFFRKMAWWEQRHGEQIARLRELLFHGAPGSLANRAAWRVEVPDLTGANLSVTLLQALHVALEAEVRAHDYYAAALEQHIDPRLEDLFEGLRQAELEHQRLIKAEIARLTA